MLDLRPDYLEIVKHILAEHIPGYEVRVFGSRVAGNAKPYSDLDLVVMTEQPLSVRQMASLKDALSESDLPFRVDVVDWATATETFRSVILKVTEIIQPNSTHYAR